MEFVKTVLCVARGLSEAFGEGISGNFQLCDLECICYFISMINTSRQCNPDLLVLVGGDCGEHGLGELHTDGGGRGGDRGDVDHGLVPVHGVQTHLEWHKQTT